jgi:phosphatidylglycerophosphate synthase
MTHLSFSFKRTSDIASRTVLSQALGLFAVLVPISVLLSYNLAALAGADAPYDAALATAVFTGLGCIAVLAGLWRGAYPHDTLGFCNVATAARGAGICVLAGLTFVSNAVAELGWILVGLASLTLLLDALDGWLARRSGLHSRFGARFDVESDVAFSIVLAVLLWQADKVGLWFVAIGLLRPAYLVASVFLPALRIPLPDAFWRKCMAAIQMSLQVALLTPFVQPPFSGTIAATLLLVMVLSFAVDIRWQWRQQDLVK